MTETKCKLCGELRECIETWSHNFCEDCVNYRLMAFGMHSDASIVFKKLIERIERLEGMLANWESVIIDDRKDIIERFEKLESKHEG